MDSPSVPLKARPGSDTIELPDFSCDGEFPRVLTQRRTWRQFGPDALSLADLSSLLGLTWGVQHWMHPGGGAKLPLKTSPSGGARHSLEAYVIAVRIEHMAPGIYHYCPDEHRLSFVSAEAPRPLLERGLPGQPGFHEASAVFLMSTLVERVQARYRSPRAYRVILLEAGHFCQTLCLVATWLGLAPFCTAALNETSLEEHLGIDGMSESVIYAAGVGARPEGVAWAPFPEPGAVPPKLTPPSYREREKGRS